MKKILLLLIGFLSLIQGYGQTVSNDSSLSAFAHEMGHCYNLTEVFDEKVNISKGSSINIMDYTQLPYMFWRWQAEDINTTIRNEK
jgi:hypothetical protein